MDSFLHSFHSFAEHLALLLKIPLRPVVCGLADAVSSSLGRSDPSYSAPTSQGLAHTLCEAGRGAGRDGTGPGGAGGVSSMRLDDGV